MGRHALRKVDPNLDLLRYFKVLDDLPRPWDRAVLFDRHAPLEIEVGSGKGLFLSNAAEASPDHDFLGIEIATKYARFSAARLAKRTLHNACMVQGDALWVFRELLPEASVAAVHGYFPDPWWKNRHHKRRVMNERFLSDVQRVLEPDGVLHFWTDVAEYFQQSLELIAESTSLEGPFDVAEREATHGLDYRTHFERRMRLQDEPVYRSEFRKPRS